MRVFNHTRGVFLAHNAQTADTWAMRFRGLMFRKAIPAAGGLILSPCSGIHTCFMRFSIDVLFVSREGTILHIIENMPPFRFSPFVREALYVIELPAAKVHQTGTCVNDRISIFAEEVPV